LNVSHSLAIRSEFKLSFEETSLFHPPNCLASAFKMTSISFPFRISDQNPLLNAITVKRIQLMKR